MIDSSGCSRSIFFVNSILADCLKFNFEIVSSNYWRDKLFDFFLGSKIISLLISWRAFYLQLLIGFLNFSEPSIIDLMVSRCAA